MARKLSLLQGCRSEVVVLTSRRLSSRWSSGLQDALESCLHRGLRVRLLLESGSDLRSPALIRLERAGAELRHAPRRLSWFLRPVPVQAEVWVLDGRDAFVVNERIPLAAQRTEPPLQLELRLGEEAARGLATYFEQRWELEAEPLAYSVRHKSYAFHSGRRAEREFFGCLFQAQQEVALSVPGGRVSRQVERALQEALREGLRVTIFTNAAGDDAPGLRRLRRLSAAGASVKICGRRLVSECAVLDGQSIYLGSLPATWQRWARVACPVLVVRNRRAGEDLLDALESQVSVEISGHLRAPAAAQR